MSPPEPARKSTSGLRFECTKCGRCCTRRGAYAHVYLSGDEIRALAAATGTSVRTFRRRYTFVDGYGWTQLRFSDDSCPFLDPSTNACTVYESRPVQCRTFPFWADMIGARGWTREARSMCEGVGRGPAHPASEVEASIREMEKSD